MGLHCSKQVYMKDFRELAYADTRLGPEGESFPKDKHSNIVSQNPNTKLTTSTGRNVNVFERYSRTSCCSPDVQMLEQRQNVVIGEESSCLLQNLTKVDLPPEGKDACEKEFVELPTSKPNNKGDDVYMELPEEHSTKSAVGCCIKYVDLPEEKSIKPGVELCSESLASLFDNEFELDNDENDTRRATRSVDNDDNWSYTLYKFQGKGLTTKQDIHLLMESICSVVGQSVCEATNNRASTDHALNVQLQIGHEKVCNNIKSPSKYTPLKHYKGMTFPPPNSEEAEKVSSYIEERLSCDRAKRSKSENRFCEQKDNHRPPMSYKCAGEEQNLYAIPKRSNLCDGRASLSRDSNNVKQNYYKNCSLAMKKKPHLHNHDSSSNSEVLSDGETPECTDDNLENLKHFGKHGEVCKIDDNYKMRLQHSCSCHRRLKERKKTCLLNDKKNKESRLCKQIKMTARKNFGDYSFNESTKSLSDSSNTDSNRSFRNSKSSIKETKKTDNKNGLSNNRPAVWPGQCSNIKNICQKTGDTSVNLEDLCFCKRMLGIDYPCNHYYDEKRNTHKRYHYQHYATAH